MNKTVRRNCFFRWLTNASIDQSTRISIAENLFSRHLPLSAHVCNLSEKTALIFCVFSRRTCLTAWNFFDIIAKTHRLVIHLKQQTPHNTIHSVNRQMKIEDCLLENMLSVPYDRISIADLCRQMGVSRRLYYTYFPDKDSCLFSLIDRYLHESIEGMSTTAVTRNDQLTQTISYLNFWKAHSDFLTMVTYQNLKGLVIDRCHLFFRDQDDFFIKRLSTPEVEADDSIIWLYAAFRFTVLLQWHEQNYSLPVEEMAKKYLRMLKSPLLHDL